MRLLLGIGSNQDAEKHLRLAKERLALLLPGIRFSRTYVFAATQGPQVPAYHNLAAIAETSLERAPLKTALRALEEDLGRNRNTPDTVAIDLDILALGDEVSPALCAHDYCLSPAAEVAPALRPPGHSQTLAELAAPNSPRGFSASFSLAAPD